MTSTETVTTITLDSGERYQVEHKDDVTFARPEQTKVRSFFRISPASDVLDTIKLLAPIMFLLCIVAAILYRQTLDSIIVAVAITLVGGCVAFCVLVLRAWKLSFLLNVESKRSHTITDLRNVLEAMLDRQVSGRYQEPPVPMHTIMRMSGGVQSRALDFALGEMRMRWNRGNPETGYGEPQTIEEFRRTIMNCYDMIIDNALRRAHDSEVGAIAGEPWNSVSGTDQRSFVIVRGDLTDEEAAEKAREAFKSAPKHR